MDLENNERVLLLGLVKEAIRQGQLEKSPQYSWDGKKYSKPRKKYGIKTLTTLYELECKLKKLRVADVGGSLKCDCKHSGSCRYEEVIQQTKEICRHKE